MALFALFALFVPLVFGGRAVNQIGFSAPPSPGTVVRLDEQEYELVRARPHIRADGAATTLLTWLTGCPDCEEPFEVTTGLAAKSLNRRCPECRKVRQRPVKGRRGRRVKVSVEEA